MIDRWHEQKPNETNTGDAHQCTFLGRLGLELVFVPNAQYCHIMYKLNIAVTSHMWHIRLDFLFGYTSVLCPRYRLTQSLLRQEPNDSADIFTRMFPVPGGAAAGQPVRSARADGIFSENHGSNHVNALIYIYIFIYLFIYIYISTAEWHRTIDLSHWNVPGYIHVTIGYMLSMAYANDMFCGLTVGVCWSLWELHWIWNRNCLCYLFWMVFSHLIPFTFRWWLIEWFINWYNHFITYHKLSSVCRISVSPQLPPQSLISWGLKSDVASMANWALCAMHVRLFLKQGRVLEILTWVTWMGWYDFESPTSDSSIIFRWCLWIH